MAVIDDKVVAMSFEASKFESGVNQAIASLEKLKASLKLPASAKGLDDIGAAAKRVDLSHIATGVDKIRTALDSLRLIAIGVMSQLATAAVRAGASFVKAFTLDPIKQGFAEYTTNLNAIQTILANTQAAGVGLKQVNATLKELNEYSDKTIYNFSQMARNIGTFTAAGVELDTATASIKGIANLAALSGSNSEQASTAMYQLSQAIAAGSVKLMDWNSVVNAGMGGTVFQRALAQTAEAMGTLEKGTVKLEGPMKNVTIAGKAFRNSLSAAPGETGWLTSGVLTSTLKQFTSDLTDAELAAMGFNKAQIKAIQQTAQTAMHAATEVKTLTQVFDVAKETAGSGWAQTFQIVFGTFTEAKKTFTDLSNAINGFINTNADARNKVLQDWKDLGGRTALIEAISTAFKNLGLILKPIKEAFRDIFPAKTGADLMYLTQLFERFVAKLRPSEETMKNIGRTFKGIFAGFSIGIQIVKGIFTVFKELFGALGGGSGGFLELTASIGDWIVSIDKALKKGDGLQKFFKGLGQILAAPVEMLSKFAGALGEALGVISSGKISDQMSGLTDTMSPLGQILEHISAAWMKLVQSIANADLAPMIEAISNAIQGIAKAIGDAASNMNFEAILAVVRTGLLGGLVLMLKNFFGKGSFLEQISGGFKGGILSNIAGSFDALRGSMVAMQNNIKADTLQKIAIAIGILTASVVALSFVDSEALTKSITAIGFMMAELMGAMAILSQISGLAGFLKVPLIAFSMIMLAGAIDILAIAVFALSKLSWTELVKGLGGVAALLGMMVIAVKPLAANSAGLISAGIGITALAIALNLLAIAVRQMGSMDLEQLAKGLGGVAIALGGIMAAMKKMPPSAGLVSAGIGMIAIAAALKVMASAVAQFGSMDLRTIAQGIGGIALVLGILVLGMRSMPTKSLLKNAIGLIAIAAALKIIASAVETMGGMSIGEVAKGLIGLAGALTILVIAVAAFQGMVAGAIALGVVAAGVSVLAGALNKMGAMSWGEIIKSLILLAGAITIMGIAGALIAPVILPLVGLGIALLAIGAALALAGAGIFLFATGLSALLVALPTGVGIMLTALREFTAGLIENAKLLALGILEIAQAFAKTAPKFAEAMVKIIESLLDVIIQSIPKITEVMIALVDMMIKVLTEKQDEIIAAGFALLLALLQGIKNNIAQVVTIVLDIVVTFLRTLASNLSRIIAAGVQIVVSLLRGVADNLPKIIAAAVDIVTKFITAVGAGYLKIVTAGATIIAKLLEGIAKNVGKVITAGADAIIDFVTGLGKNAKRVIEAGVDAVLTFIQGLGKNAVELAEGAAKVIVQFLNGLTAAINRYAPQIQEASKQLGWAIINGMTWGLAGRAEDVYRKAEEIAGRVLSILKKVPGISSPAKETIAIGEFMMMGLVKGMDNNTRGLFDTAEDIAWGVIGRFQETFQTKSPSKVMYEIGQFVAQGFADGLRDGKAGINQAFEELNTMLTEAITNARETIVEEEAKLAELRKAKTPDMEAIKAAEKAIAESESILKRSVATREALVNGLKAEKAELIKLAVDYDNVTNKLKAAQDELKRLQEEKAAAITSISEQYGTLPGLEQEEGITGADQLAQYMTDLANQADAVAKYRETLEQLRALGLDKATYEKLLQEGTADQEFATALLAGGKTAIEGLNKLDKELKIESDKLGLQAGNNLKNAGIAAAKGLIAGLKSQKAALIKEMEDMADAIVAAFNRRLKVKSPSRVMMEAGQYMMEGLAIGISSSVSGVKRAVEDAANVAISAMTSSIQKISDAVSNELNVDPVITPVLDLTTIRSQAAELGALTNVTPITAAASYGQASVISAEQLAAQGEELAAAGVGGTSVKFEQNNYSPESLTEIEIYRQTKNQLSQLKTVLSLS